MEKKLTKKKANGSGSVYRRKDGRVVGVWEDIEGRTRYVTSKTKTDIHLYPTPVEEKGLPQAVQK